MRKEVEISAFIKLKSQEEKKNTVIKTFEELMAQNLFKKNIISEIAKSHE